MEARADSPPTDRITIPIFDADEMVRACDDAFSSARTAFDELSKIDLSDVTVANILEQWDRIFIELEDVIGPVAILNSVSPDAAVRDAGDDCLLKLSSFNTELFQNVELYERVRAVDALSGSPEFELRKDLLDAFEDSGVSLGEAARARVREIHDEITALGQEFAKNIRDNSKRLKFTPAECDGLPDSYLERVDRDEDGNIIVGFDYPDFHPFMMTATSSDARRRYYAEYNNRGTEANPGILDQIVRLRVELAELYGAQSYAVLVTRRRMVGDPETVHKFLDEVASVVAEVERADLDELSELKAETTGESKSEAQISRWDVQYYSEKLRERKYAVDQESLRKHFPTLPTLGWLLKVTEHLYGIRFRRTTVEAWHEDVLVYDVFEDDASETYIGAIYLDLFPRDGKYKHAAAWPVRGVSRRTGRTPISALVTNFDRVGLTPGELDTLFHEFGHVMHGVLSATDFNFHSGTSVKRDFVEAPSQMYEEWARRWESLKTLSDEVPDVPKIDEALVERLRKARQFGQGLRYARQHLYATYDMELAGPNPGEVLAVWRRMEGAGLMGHVDGTAFPGTFGHITDGYAAGYYGYMWSEVLALDMLSAFGDDLMNAEVGRRFRTIILASGGQRSPLDLVIEFLGREPSSDAFFREIRGAD